MNPVIIGNIPVGKNHPPILIAGPCVIESLEMLLRTGEEIQNIARKNGFPYILKCSFEKANRTAKESFRGPGLEKGLQILSKVKKELNVPVLTDIHLPEQAAPAAQVIDCLQIPAFLSRQTTLIEVAAATGLPINIKKAQFMAPIAIRFAVQKAASSGKGGVLVTERGTSFGYGDLIVDMRSLVIMSKLDVPVIFDATHSIQQPGADDHTSGQNRFIEPLAQAAAATGAVDGIFIEVHPDPPRALSDAASQLPLERLDSMLDNLRRIFDAASSGSSTITESSR